MHEKTVVITGATNGIGRATAEGIARLGATLILACRNRTAAESTAREIIAATGNSKIQTIHLDLSSLASARAAAEGIRRKSEKIDVLINNAGVFFMKRRVTEDGFEMTMGVNHLGHFLFTSELLELLRRGSAARIINVASDAHLHGSIDFEDFFLEKRYSGFKAYAASRLATVLYTIGLSDRLNSSGITVNSLHPGHVATNMWNLTPARPFLGRIIKAVTNRFLLSAEEGAATSIYLASSPEVQGVTGLYFAKCAPAKMNPLCEDRQIRRKLMQTSAMLTGAIE